MGQRQLYFPGVEAVLSRQVPTPQGLEGKNEQGDSVQE